MMKSSCHALNGPWRYLLTLVAGLLIMEPVAAQETGYWQQRVEYQMDIDMDAENHQYDGQQTLTYYNNSPDTLSRVFYHLYFNAFQPGSMMDVRSRTIEDPDRRVGSRIAKLSEEEQGYIKVDKLEMNGRKCRFESVGTILEVVLPEPVLPGEKTVLEMDYQAQVPLQIRRSGRDNREGIEFSMSQWYPKIAEYDEHGWHPNPYVGREFYGVWGDYNVKITIDSSYVLGGTGYLQNPQACGHGYQDSSKPLQRPKGKKLTWHFKASDVHDFVWAADPDYRHDIVDVPGGPKMHFLYQNDSNILSQWSKLPEYMVEAFQYMNKRFGKYIYDKYSFIQGGDGGMEYPMATLITGNRGLQSLVGVSTHEMIHSWFHGMLATNEARYPWMDEGFTTYATSLLDHKFFGRDDEDPFRRSYQTYFRLTQTDNEEALSTHADHYETNRAYGIGSYSKGCIFLHQLSYIVGQETFDRGMLRYYRKWAFKHPGPEDFIKVMEDESGLVLDWYLRYWTHTTDHIDYAVRSVDEEEGREAIVTLENKAQMPMPLDVQVTFSDGSERRYYIPMRLMRGGKPREVDSLARITVADWPWTHPYYELRVDLDRKQQIEKIEIDPSQRMADVERENNVYPLSEKNITAGSALEDD